MTKELVNFSIRSLNRSGPFYGFELYKDPLHLMPDGTVFHNSGKSVLEQGIVSHVSRFPDRFQLVGVNQFAHSCPCFVCRAPQALIERGV